MSITSEARRTAKLLSAKDLKVVFAESCTGGFVAASLTKIPGISAHHCGGFVVYRNETKMAYLNISARILKNPGPVSRIVAEKMALGVLEKTPEANIAASVTGHLGPQAPLDLDGVIYIGVARRGHLSDKSSGKKPELFVRRYSCATGRTRVLRQQMVIEQVLRYLNRALTLPLPDDMPAHFPVKRKELCQFLMGEIDALCVGGDLIQTGSDDPPFAPLIFPGAFNPLHDGHRRMADEAARVLGASVEYEISIDNVDKPPLTSEQIVHRVTPFGADEAVWLTHAPTFVEKANLFPGAVFVVGIDTLNRIADSRYYGGEKTQFDQAMEQIASRGCEFFVFGRKQRKRFLTLKDIELPANLRRLCKAAPDSFRVDVSSTEIRQNSSENAKPKNNSKR